jgi:hypothetical protein
MKRTFLLVPLLFASLFSGLSFGRPNAFAQKSSAKKASNPAPLDLHPLGPLETATFALG